MNNLVKIIVSIVGLCLIYLWITATFQSCQNKKNESDNIELVNENLDDGEVMLDKVEDELFEDGDLNGSTESPNEDSFVEFEDEPFEDEQISSSPKKTTPSPSPSPSPRPKASSNSGGQYLLISGNYLDESNAKNMRSKLNNMGFASAEIAIFDGSSYHTVIASRYNTYNEGLQAASTLKQKGIDCYVKRKS